MAKQVMSGMGKGGLGRGAVAGPKHTKHGPIKKSGPARDVKLHGQIVDSTKRN